MLSIASFVITAAYFLFLPSKKGFYLSLLLVGSALIATNLWLLYYEYGQAFVGSDATYLYDLAVNVYEGRQSIVSVDARYRGYAIYQLAMSYPYLSQPLVASFLIKLGGWSLFVFSLSRLDRNLSGLLPSTNGYYTFGIIMSAACGLTLAQFNFRDIVIASILISLASCYLSWSRYRLVFIAVLLVTLLFFRFFYVPLIVLAYLVAIVTPYKIGIGRFRFTGFWLVVPVVIVTILVGVLYSDVISRYFMVDGVVFLQNSYTITGVEQGLALSILKGLFAGNPVIFFNDFFVRSIVSRSFVLTGVSGSLFFSLFFLNPLLFASFFLVIAKPALIAGQLKSLAPKQKKERKRKILLAYTVIFFVLESLILYSIAFGGVQERHRAVFLSLIAIVFAIAYGTGAPHNRFIYTALVASLLIVLGLIVS